MRKIILLLLSVISIMTLTGCMTGVETDYAAAIMVEGEIYLKTATAIPAEIDESGIIGYTKSYTETFPKKDGQTNFSRKTGLPYARVEDGIAILIENEWYLCTPMEQSVTKCQDEAAGYITFYTEPTIEHAETVTIKCGIELTEEQAEKLKTIIDSVDEDKWVDDHSVDRLAYYFDGDIQFIDREHTYRFTYEYNVIYYDHYFAEIPEEDMQYIKSMAEVIE